MPHHWSFMVCPIFALQVKLIYNNFTIINRLFQMKQNKAMNKLGGEDKACHETHNDIH